MDVEAVSEQEKKVRQHWQLIELAARHDYIPNGANGQVIELKNVYHGSVDLWCGHCIVQMCKWYYEKYKEKK